jgi:hypothetical protein
MRTDLTGADLRESFDAIHERAENLDVSLDVAALYVDTALLPTLLPLKNQIVYGRRGTGKTHLLLRLAAEYRDTFPERRALPVFIDGRHIRYAPAVADSMPVALSICYRRFVEALVTSLRDLMHDEIALNVFERIWPGGGNRKRAARIAGELERLRRLSRFGEVEPGQGRGDIEVAQRRAEAHAAGVSLDAKVRATVLQGIGGAIEARAAASASASEEMEESLKLTYEALAILNFRAIADGLKAVLDELETRAVVILFDEWSAIPRAYQPAFADMLRSTQAGTKQIVVKFGCIPFHTQLALKTAGGERIGFPVGEEVFVDADLDRLCNSYTDAGGTAVFLLSVLHRHLGMRSPEVRAMAPQAATPFLIGRLFENEAVVSELLTASAGIPRDFLRIVVTAYRRDPDALPISERRARQAIHDFFTNEKSQQLVEVPPETQGLFDRLFKDVCMPAETPFFFVSTAKRSNTALRELWDARLIHLLHADHVAFAGGKPGTYDVYVMDYGRFASMRNTAKGEEMAGTLFGGLWQAIATLPFVGLPLVVVAPPIEASPKLAEAFAGLIAGISKVDADLGDLLEDASPVVVDRLLPD